MVTLVPVYVQESCVKGLQVRGAAGWRCCRGRSSDDELPHNFGAVTELSAVLDIAENWPTLLLRVSD